MSGTVTIFGFTRNIFISIFEYIFDKNNKMMF